MILSFSIALFCNDMGSAPYSGDVERPLSFAPGSRPYLRLHIIIGGYMGGLRAHGLGSRLELLEFYATSVVWLSRLAQWLAYRAHGVPRAVEPQCNQGKIKVTISFGKYRLRF